MDDQERQELTERSISLRIELKAWEKIFAAANDGKKASREDIKQNLEIAAKYKEYNKIRDILSGKSVQQPAELKRQTPRKRKHDEVGHGVSKRQHITKTPSRTLSRSSLQPWEVDPYESPSVIRSLFTPSKKALGPTPQKNGVVLGLFDLLQSDISPKTADGHIRGEGKDKIVPVQATPRKSGTDRLNKTPSSIRQFMLENLTTPLKTKDLNEQGGRTPSSVSKLHWSTPSFLRRDSQRISLASINENGPEEGLSPQMVRVPRKPLVRGLSSILAGLRKIEEDAADEDLEALHEMEAEEQDPGHSKLPAKTTVEKDAVLVADSQPGFPLGGFDDEAMYDSQLDEQDLGLGLNGQPLKIYKKKGQKRTTRRVKMRPTRSKHPQTTATIPEEDEDGDDPASDDDEPSGELDEAVPETQHEEPAAFTDARNFDSDTQSEYTASEGGTRYKRPNQNRKNKSANKDGKIKTAARKANSMAHQNFKRLKLRNSGAKGGPAHNSRFRRKR